MKNLLFKVSMAFIAINLIFASCKKDDPKPSEGKAEDVTIAIDETSAFNMKNFIISFNQMFVSDSRWQWEFTHDYKDGKAVTSYQNYTIFGKFGNAIQTTTHHYNEDGVITSSSRISNMYPEDILTFEYEYDLEGFIVKLIKYRKDNLVDVVKHEYNDNNQLIKKIHLNPETNVEEWHETFTYNSDGTVAIYEDSEGDKSVYSYSSGKMVQVVEYYEGEVDDTEKYEYDSEGRAIKAYGDGDSWYAMVEYASDMLTIYEYEDDVLYSKEEHGYGFVELKSYDFNYNNGLFEYCRARESDDDGNTAKKYYYEGSIENLQLVGYTIIDSRDENKGDKKTKESVYNASGTKLYYAEFTISGSDDDYYVSSTHWYSADGTAIDESEISEDWVFVLVR